MSIILILLVLVNFGISWFNAWSVGRSWAETKAYGGLPRFMAWMGAVMSACGFTWVYLVLLCAGAQIIPYNWGDDSPYKTLLPAQYAEMAFRLGYLVIILPVIGSGTAITIQSWMYFWRERNWKSGAIAGWNTFADIYNIYNACKAIPESFDFIGAIFKSKSDGDAKGKLILLAFVLVILALLGGILTTTAIIRTTARRVANSMKLRAYETKASY